jgi:hypothetical protein
VRRAVAAVWLIVILTAVTVCAADFWETKPFATWSDKEVRQLLTDSPWSHGVQVVLNVVGRSGALGESEGAGGRGRGAGGDAGADAGGGGGRGGGGRGGGTGFVTAAPQLKLQIAWRSAMPMKQALVRSQIGAAAPIPEAFQQFLDRPEPQYIVSIEGLPARYAPALEAMKANAVLKRGNRTSIACTALEAQQVATGVVVAFGFPKDDPISAADKDVEFFTKLGQFEIKKKFSLKEMTFHGQLEL